MTTAQIHSVQALHHYTEALASRQASDNPAVRNLQVAKRMTWLILLALAFLFYYLIDRMEHALLLLR